MINKISSGRLEDAGFEDIVFNYIDDIIYQICPDAPDLLYWNTYCVMRDLIEYGQAEIMIKGQLKIINNAKELLEAMPCFGGERNGLDLL